MKKIIAVLGILFLATSTVQAGAIMTPDQAAWVGYGVGITGALNDFLFIPSEPYHRESRYEVDTNAFIGTYKIKNHADPWMAFLLSQPFLLGVGFLDGWHIDHIMMGEVSGMFTNVAQTAKYEVNLMDHAHEVPRVVFIHQDF